MQSLTERVGKYKIVLRTTRYESHANFSHQWKKKQLESSDDVPDPFVRAIEQCSVKKCETPTSDHVYDPIGSTFDTYEVTVKSKGFLHNQVRRMVGLAQVRERSPVELCRFLKIRNRELHLFCLILN